MSVGTVERGRLFVCGFRRGGVLGRLLKPLPMRKVAMTDIGFGMVDKRSVAAILFALVLASVLGLKIPVDTTSVRGLFADIVLLTGALYLGRSVLRLPVIAIVKIKEHKESLSYARWYVYEFAPQAFRPHTGTLRWILMFDRFSLIGLSFLVCLPQIKTYVTFIGAMGLVLMLLVYISTDSFSFLVRDAIDAAQEREEKLTEMTAAKVTVTREDRSKDYGP